MRRKPPPPPPPPPPQLRRRRRSHRQQRAARPRCRRVYLRACWWVHRGRHRRRHPAWSAPPWLVSPWLQRRALRRSGCRWVAVHRQRQPAPTAPKAPKAEATPGRAAGAGAAGADRQRTRRRIRRQRRRGTGDRFGALTADALTATVRWLDASSSQCGVVKMWLMCICAGAGTAALFSQRGKRRRDLVLQSLCLRPSDTHTRHVDEFSPPRYLIL